MATADRSTPAGDSRRSALAAFVRAHRERLAPTAVGLPAGQRRRTPGLRREELAELSGLSTTWITWIEQGRDVSLSGPALMRLARALRLQPAERAYLFELAGRRDPAAGHEPEADAPAALLRAVQLVEGPAYLLDRGWTALAWNHAAADLFDGWLDPASTDRNLMRYVVLSEAAGRLIEDRPERLRRVVAEFRADLSRHLDDQGMAALVDALLSASPAFAEAWHEQAVLGREGGLRRFRHPRRGALAYEQITLVPANRPDLKLVMLTPHADSAAQSRSTAAR